MPLIAHDILCNYLCDGTIKAYTIDTNIFYGCNFDFSTYPLNAIKHTDTPIKLVLPNIIYYEIEKNYIAEYDIQTISNKIAKMSSIDSIKGIYESMKRIDIKRECVENLNGIFTPREDYVINISDFINIDVIIDMYFHAKPPFEDNKDKKCEFPDAIALNALENYALKQGISILTISFDAGWERYCANSNKLYALNRIHRNQKELLLECLQAFKSIDSNNTIIIDNIKNLISTSFDVQSLIKNCINTYLQSNTDCIIPYCDSSFYYDSEINDIGLISVDFNNLKVYLERIDNGKAIIFCTLLAKICIFVTFEESVWDSEDREYVLIGTKSKSKEEADVNFDLTITACINDHNLNCINIEECDVSPEDIEIDFGCI